jgi:hypothetical protein
MVEGLRSRNSSYNHCTIAEPIVPLFVDSRGYLAFTKRSKIPTPVQRRRPATPHETMDNFDSLKREATKLERQLEDKVSRYQQVSFFLSKSKIVTSMILNSHTRITTTFFIQ